MVEKKKFNANKTSEEEILEIKKHRAIIVEKEKQLLIKHKEMWEEKKKSLKGFKPK
mgnify:FL=1|jgi:hypothetical protein|tara:strand:+ start:1431 stop:1598 length:168 start_codon:yes stop_codon:yes gene_type:complete